MTKDSIMAEWRKQRKAGPSPSNVGQRPLHENWINSSENYQPSAEPALQEEYVVCCKHGHKCSEYYAQKLFEKKRFSSLWPMFELCRRDGLDRNWVGKNRSINQFSLNSKERQSAHETNKDALRQENDDYYDNIISKSKEILDEPAKTAIESSRETVPLEQKSAPEKLVEDLFPATASKLEMMCRFYLGQKPPSTVFPVLNVAQSFRLYHELPEDVSNLDNLKLYAPLCIMFTNNDLECRRLPVRECIVKGKRKLYVDCGDENAPKFKKLDYLVRHYASNFAYNDRQGRKTRFPDNAMSSKESFSSRN